MHAVLVGLLVVLGRSRPALAAQWTAVQPQLQLSLLGEMERLDPVAGVGDAAAGRMWRDSSLATDGLTSDEVHAKGSLPVQVMLQWLEAARLTRRVATLTAQQQRQEA